MLIVAMLIVAMWQVGKPNAIFNAVNLEDASTRQTPGWLDSASNFQSCILHLRRDLIIVHVLLMAIMSVLCGVHCVESRQ